MFLSGFKQIWIFSTDFHEAPSIKCHGNTSSEGCADSADRRTDIRRDMTKLIALFATTWKCVQSCRLCCVYLLSFFCTAIVYRTGQSPASYDEVPGAAPSFKRRKRNIFEKWSWKRLCNSFIPYYKQVCYLQQTFTYEQCFGTSWSSVLYAVTCIIQDCWHLNCTKIRGR